MAQPAESPRSFSYAPSRFPGLLIHGLLTLLLGAVSIFGFRYFSQQEPGIAFFLSFIFSILLLIPFAFSLYRSYSLYNGLYTLARDSLTIKWGLRREIIPLSEINWIRTPVEMKENVPWPFMPMPGAYAGKVLTESGQEIEFMASNIRTMLFVGTAHGIFGISPRKPQQFLEGFERVLQMGVLAEPPHQSVKPVDWIASSWGNRIARLSLIYSVVFFSLLSLWIGFRFSAARGVDVEFTAEGIASQRLPARNILLLPILSIAIWLVNLIVGVQLYKNERLKPVAEMVWSSSAAILFLILIAGFLIF